MSWQGQLSTMVRYLIDDTDSDSYTYSHHRIETSILVAAQMSVMNIDFANDYTINVESCTLSPDPTDTDTKDEAFITLICLKTACIIIGGTIRSQSGCAIAVKDGHSSIDYRGVTATLATLYKDLCDKYEQLLLDYRAGNSVAGHAILGPYSPGSDLLRNNFTGHRAGGNFT